MREKLETAGRKDLAKCVWVEIASCLESQKRKVYDEIGKYPTPITACDQQFNYLLEQQARISEELSRMRTAIAEIGTHDDPVVLVDDFVQSSKCVDDETKQRIRARLKQGA